MEAKISEIFFSIQGEGIYQFIPQIFVRFWGCDIGCCFCDTRNLSYKIKSLEEVVKEIFSFKNFFYHSISLTGGEPLIQKDFLKSLCRVLKERGQVIYLETNGILYKNLGEVLDYLDIIAMDFKLPSSTQRGPFWQEHREFLKIAKEKEVFVKAVITPSTVKEDLIRAVEIIKTAASYLPFVLQPVFSYELVLHSKLEEFKRIALDYIERVEIIPQVHKHLALR